MRSDDPNNIHGRHIKLIFSFGLLALVGMLVVGNIYYDKIQPMSERIQLGVSFSPNYAFELGLDWKATYQALLTDLSVKNLRLFSYWTDIEPQPGKFHFADLDWMVEQAGQHSARVLLVVGAKQPRWPECRFPSWVLTQDIKHRQQETLEFITAVVDRYKHNSVITAWQVENEPLFHYGAFCDPIDKSFLAKEVGVVKKLDPIRPIVISDSGELGFWNTSMALSDVFGTTLYRGVYNPLFGYFYWPIPPAFYNFKSNVVRQLFARDNRETIVIELQAEPWLPQEAAHTPVAEQLSVFTVDSFSNNVEFAKRTGFDQIYLWGAEWWYFMAKQGHPEYLDFANSLF